jgi:ferredoxin-nitrate reductase
VRVDTYLEPGVTEADVDRWMRMLDRRCGPDPPTLLVIDPRPTARQVNNVHLLRACSGGPAPASNQINGQPTAQNTRETGADGDLPGLRNWNNPEHIRQLAELWTSTRSRSPTGPNRPTRCRSSRYAEQGSIKLLWVSATNPVVSLPDLPRIRRILAQEDLFVIV